MKTCPVCKAQAFDDAEVCYGCLYRFEWDDSDECPYHSSDSAECFFLEDDESLLEEPELPIRAPFVANSVTKAQPLLTVPAHTVVAQGVRSDACFSASLPATLVIQLQIQQSSVDQCLA